MNDSLFTKRQAARNIRRENFKQVSTKEIEHYILARLLSIFTAISSVTATEVEEAIKRMKSGKATEVDDILSELIGEGITSSN